MIFWREFCTVAALLFLPAGHTAKNYCVTPRNETGTCTKLLKCPSLKSMIRKEISEGEKDFLRQSYCTEVESNDVIPQVCCHPMDQCMEDCGWFSSAVFGSYLNPPNLDDFSWLVLVQEEAKRNSSEFVCAGTLVSDRYVLTAAHCFSQTVMGRRLSVRLGDVQLGKSPDCMHGECLDSEFNIAVEEVILHGAKDVALVKLNESLVFERAVSPICLFGHVEDMDLSMLEIVGFKTEGGVREKSLVDLRRECEPGMICVESEECAAMNSGGPLMKLVHHDRFNTRYMLVGVQSAGDCRRMKFTETEPLLEWIRLNVKPY